MEQIKNIIQASIDVKKQILESEELISTIDKVVSAIALAFQNGHHVYFCGNGGSAANASHFVTDLGKGSSDKIGSCAACACIPSAGAIAIRTRAISSMRSKKEPACSSSGTSSKPFRAR